MKVNSVKTNTHNNYNNKCNKLNFNANINIIDPYKFFRETQKIQGHISFVESPWTPKDIKRGKQVVTQFIKTCTAGGIIVESLQGIRDVVMFHLNPDRDECKNFDKIKEVLDEKIDASKPIQAFMVGSKDNDGFLKYSGDFFENLWQKVISKFNVPTTFLKGIPMGGYGVDLYCDTPNDTLLVSCSVRNNFPPFDKARETFLGFKDVKISELDKLELD